MAGEWNSVDRLADQLTDLHVPQFCEKCGGIMEFRGVGEYKCEQCGFLDYDDYGKVRIGLERFPGMTIAEAEMRTGVSQRTIRKLLKEGRIMLTEDSKVMLSCERCGSRIRYGRFCAKCEKLIKQELKADQKNGSSHQNTHVFGLARRAEERGRKRYTHEE